MILLFHGFSSGCPYFQLGMKQLGSMLILYIHTQIQTELTLSDSLYGRLTSNQAFQTSSEAMVRFVVLSKPNPDAFNIYVPVE